MNEYEIIKIYEQMERELIRSMTRNLKRHQEEEKKVGFKFSQWQAEKLRSLQQYRKENKHIIEAYTKGLDKDVAGMLSEEMKKGKLEALKGYEKAVKEGYKAEVDVPAKFFKTNTRKANAFIKVINNDLKTANNAALRRSNDIYREVIHKASTFVGNGVYTERQAVDMAIKEFKEKGINCIVYKNGARHTISDYSGMAIRTANQRATLMAEGEFRKKIGETLVIVSKHGTACKICQEFENRVFIDDVYSGGTAKDGNYPLLSQAMKEGMFHPNCRHGLNTYYEGITEVADTEATEQTIQKVFGNKEIYDIEDGARILNYEKATEELFKELGYDLKPEVIEELDKDKIVLYRGYHGGKALEYIEQYKYGDNYVPSTMMGKGTFVTIDKASALNYSDDGMANVITLQLKDDCKIITKKELEEKFAKYCKQSVKDFDNFADKQAFRFFSQDKNMYAARLGYDVIEWDEDYIILNRSAVKVLEEKAKKEIEYRYHSTSLNAVQGIFEKGLLPSTRGQYGKAVYFAPDIAGTKGWTSEEKERVVMRVSLNKLKEKYSYDEFEEQGMADKIVNSKDIEVLVGEFGKSAKWIKLSEYIKNKRKYFFIKP